MTQTAKSRVTSSRGRTEVQRGRTASTPEMRTDSVHENAGEEDFVYTPRGVLEVDKDLREHFEGQGYALRWIRWQLDGKIDADRLDEIDYQGWTPVKTDEIDSFKLSRLNTQEIAGFGNVLAKKDVALFKIPLQRQAKIVEYYENLSSEQMKNANQRLRDSDAGSVLNESKSETAVGKNSRKTHFS